MIFCPGELPLRPPDDEAGTWSGSVADGDIPRQLKFLVDTAKAARSHKYNSDPRSRLHHSTGDSIRSRITQPKQM